LFLWVNNTYGFYTSWADLAGRTGGTAAIAPNTVVAGGGGRVEVIRVAGSPGTDGSHQVLVWLPKQYDQPSARTTRFPVVMVLPGQPSTPQAMFTNYDFAATATAAIDGGHVKPFIAVFPPLMTNPPRDTECTNLPAGPQAETWLVRDVYGAVRRNFRASTSPWSLVGWSTGAFCSAKLLLHHPAQYAAAAGLGGYYETLSDHTTGNLFGSRAAVKEHNSPLWLYRHGGLHARRLLVVTGREDHESYAATQKFLTATSGDADVSSLIFPTGGHNYRNYRVLLPSVLQWLSKVRAIT
jgi:S-formylglutathione hydrolase FrmB